MRLVLMVFFLGFFSLLGQEIAFFEEEITAAQIEGGFRLLAFEDRLEPQLGVGVQNAKSWLDGVVGLDLSGEVEDELIRVLGESKVDLAGDLPPLLSPEKVRWAQARFYELRGRDEEAMALFDGAEELSDFERLGFVRLMYRAGRLPEARGALSQVVSWGRIRLEAEVVRHLDGLDAYGDFLGFLETALPPAHYRAFVYPVQLDLAFHRGEWRAALEKSAKLGPPWHLLALNHYGEIGKCEEEFRKFTGVLTVHELALLPAGLVYEAMKGLLKRGELSLLERRRAVESCYQASSKEGDWLVEWFHDQPAHFKSDLLWLARKCGGGRTLRVTFLGILDDELFEVEEHALAWALGERTDLESRELKAVIKEYQDFGKGGVDASTLRYAADLEKRFPHSYGADLDDFSFLLSQFRRVEGREELARGVIQNPAFADLSGLERLGYFKVGGMERAFLRELEGRSWSTLEALEVLQMIVGAIPYVSPVEVKEGVADWMSEQALKLGEGEHLIPDFVGKWVSALRSLRLTNDRLELEKQKMVALLKTRGIDFTKTDGPVMSRLPMRWARSFLMPRGALNVSRTPTDFLIGKITRPQWDRALGYAVLALKDPLPLMQVEFCFGTLPGLLEVRMAEMVFLPQRRSTGVARPQFAVVFQEIDGLSGEISEKFQKALFHKVGLPAEGVSFEQALLRHSLSSLKAMLDWKGRVQLLRDWSGEMDLELKLGQAVLRYRAGGERAALEKVARELPRAYLRRFQQAKTFMKEGGRGDMGRPGRVIDKPEDEVLRQVMGDWPVIRPDCLAAFDRLREESFRWRLIGKDAGQRRAKINEVVQLIAENPRNTEGGSLISALSRNFELTQDEEKGILEALERKIGGLPGGAQAFRALHKWTLTATPSIWAGGGWGDPFDAAWLYFKSDPGNVNLLRVLISETREEGRDFEALWEAADRFIAHHDLAQFAEALRGIPSRPRTEKRHSDEAWKKEFLGYLYRQESHTLHERQAGLSLPGFHFVRNNEWEIAEYRKWLSKSETAGFALWDHIAMQLFNNKMPKEALEWVMLALGRNGGDLAERQGVGISAGYRRFGGVDFWSGLLKTDHFSEVCRSLDGKIRTDLPVSVEVLILLGVQTPQAHERISELLKFEGKREAERAIIERELDQLEDLLKQHENRRKLQEILAELRG